MSTEQLLNYETDGDADHPAIILIHGLFGDLDNLKSISRALSDDYHVINVDVRNHGESLQSDDMNYQQMADDVIAVADHLALDKFYLLGHSMGGKIAMEIALSNPTRLYGLIVADIAPVAYEARHSDIIDALCALDTSDLGSRKEADEQLASSISEAGVRQFLLKNLRRDGDQWQWRFNLPALQANYDALIGAPSSDGQYTGPVYFIRGERSDYVMKQHSDAIGQRFPNATAKTIGGTGHWLHAEKPQQFNRLVSEFLQANPPA